MRRALHDGSYEAPAETRAYVEALEEAELHRKEAPKGAKSLSMPPRCLRE